MAYDRSDRQGWRDEPRGSNRDRYSGDRYYGDRYRDREDRGFFERAGDEIASWFGDDDSERRRHRDEIRDDRDEYRSPRSSRQHWDRDNDRSYRPMSRAQGPDRDFGWDDDRDFGRRRESSRFERGRARSDYSGSASSPQFDDPHYESWKRRRMEELDRDYSDYRRECETKFEEDFSNWRSRRQTKRQLLGQVREHMEVTGNDGEHVGTVDRVAGDRIILTKSDPESGGAHHSIPCTMIDKVDDKVLLDVDAEKAKKQWRDDSRERALFEREDQGEAGPHILDRSFSGTYR